jgi:hypothetical protein
MERYYTSIISLVLDNNLAVVKLGENDYGVYAGQLRNHFGTPLMARGTKGEIDEFLAKNDLSVANNG